jgi:single-strand DNA-binding protein
MSHINDVTLEAFVGREPKIIKSDDGAKMARLSLGSTERYTDRSGNVKERTAWVPVAIYDTNKAEFVQRNVHTGSHVLVKGKLETRTWEQDGQNRQAIELAVRPYNGMLRLLNAKPQAEAKPDARQAIGNRPQAVNGSNPNVGE